jgi:hypothetical protein
MDVGLQMVFASYGWSGLRLYAKEVLPVVHSWTK